LAVVQLAIKQFFRKTSGGSSD